MHPVTQAPAISLVGVLSRQTHGAAGDFDLPIVLVPGSASRVTVEPRSIGAGHRIVFNFSGAVVSLGSVNATDSSGGVLAATPAISGSEISVLLNDAVDRRTVTILLNGVNNLVNASVSVSLFVGDVDGNYVINSGDFSAIKARGFLQSVVARQADGLVQQQHAVNGAARDAHSLR